VPELRPPFGFGFAGLHRKLRERLEEIEDEIDGIVLGEVSADTLTLTATEYNSGNATNVKAALREIAGSGRTNQTVKSVADAVGDKYTVPGGGIPSTHMTTDVQNALTAAGSAYQKPTEGIPATDLAGDVPADKLITAVQTSLGKADSAYQLPIGGVPEAHISADVTSRLPRFGIVKLTGDNFNGPPTVVLFGQPTFAQVGTGNTQPFALTNGMTSLVEIEGGAPRTATYVATPGYEMSGENPMANLAAETDTKLKFSVDGEDAETITFDWGGCTTALLTATQMQTKFHDVFAGTIVVVTPQTWELNTETANAGTFTVTQDGVTSAAHAYNADPNDVQADLQTKWGSDDITVTHAVTTFTIKIGETFTNLRGAAGLTADLAGLSYGNGGAATFTQVVPSPFRYYIRSPRFGTISAVEISRADELDVCDELKLGPAGANRLGGTGDFVNIAAATAQEVLDVLDAALTADPVALRIADDRVWLETTNTGPTATIEFDGAGTANTALGLSAKSQGLNGLGYLTSMADTNYVVVANVEGETPTAFMVRVHDKTEGQFQLTPIDSDGETSSETEAADDNVSVVIYGTPASS